MKAARRIKLAILIIAPAMVATACSDGGSNDSAGDDCSAQFDTELTPEVEEAKAEADRLGLRFATSREAILACAEEEGHLTAFWSLANTQQEHLQATFGKDYPFLAPVEVLEMATPEARDRFTLEYESGAAQGIGVNYIGTEVYNEFADMCDWDIYGMAKAGILDIPLEMIDPKKRTVVAAGSTAGVFAYNSDAFEAKGIEVPTTWEDLLDPAVYGRDAGFNMLGDVVIQNYSAMAVAWGIEGAKKYYAEFFDELEPTPINRFGPFLVQMAQGEFDGLPFVNLHSVWDRARKYPNLKWEIIDPVPVRLSDLHCVFGDEVNDTPYASLLFVEWTGSDAGQKALESGDQPYQSHYASDYEGGLADILEGHELSVNGFETFEESPGWIEAIIGAAGFPQPAAK